MKSNKKKSMFWAVVLVLLGVAALYVRSNWLALLIPAAILVWYGAAPTLRSGRN